MFVDLFLTFSRRVQEVHRAKGFEELGEIKWELAFCLLIVFVIVYFALWKGIKSSGKVGENIIWFRLSFYFGFH